MSAKRREGISRISRMGLHPQPLAEPPSQQAKGKTQEKEIAVVMHGIYQYLHGMETLSDEGRRQMRACAAALRRRADGKTTAVYSAPDFRARESAAMLCSRLGCENINERQELAAQARLGLLLERVRRDESAEFVILVADHYVSHALGQLLGKRGMYLSFGAFFTATLKSSEI